ncbi:MAG TPA: hypothetical protein VF519_15385 [Mycobacteriales bacterium]|jgi:hypothetical protein
MVKHVLVAAAAAATLFGGGTASAARQCAVTCSADATNPCHVITTIDCGFCVFVGTNLEQCFFEPPAP